MRLHYILFCTSYKLVRIYISYSLRGNTKCHLALTWIPLITATWLLDYATMGGTQEKIILRH